MIGCDIVKISRFEINLERLAKHILTDKERIEYDKTLMKTEYLAGRWCAKEAIYKVVGKTEKLSILNEESGKPYVLNHSELYISISHEKEYCMAVALKV